MCSTIFLDIFHTFPFFVVWRVKSLHYILNVSGSKEDRVGEVKIIDIKAQLLELRPY
jgi:hypothetical protein